jgi:cupin 2 domain-containing protein
MIYFEQHYYILLIFLITMGFLSGFIDSISGGGGLVSVPALTLTGMPMVSVLGTNKLQSSIGTSIAVFKYYQHGLLNLRTIYRGLLFGLIGSVCGAISVNLISNHFMVVLIPFVMLGVYVFNLFNKKIGIHPGIKRLSEPVFFSIFGFILGFYDSFFGPGTGNFWLISIVFFLGYTFIEAAGYAKMFNLKSNVFSLIIFLYFGKVNFIYGFTMATGQIAGNYCGAHMVILRGSKVVRPLFMAVVFLTILIMFYQLYETMNTSQFWLITSQK